MMSRLIRAISENGGVLFCAVDSTDIVREAERIHKTSAVTSAALGRLLTAASMMGVMLKSEKDSLTLRIKGGGPSGTVLAVSDGAGNVRGYVEQPVVELPPRADGKLDVGGAVGRDGTLSVVKDLGMKEPYVGQVPLVSGEIAEDITAYYAVSEQTPTVCALGVLVDRDLSILTAGGYLLQLLPGASDAEITHLEQNVAALPSVTELLRSRRVFGTDYGAGSGGLRPECVGRAAGAVSMRLQPGRVWNARCFRLGGMSLRKWRRRASLLRFRAISATKNIM